MQCAKFEQRLQELLDDRKNVEQDKLLDEHAGSCIACGSVWRAQRQLFAGLQPIPEPSFAPNLGHRVLDQLRIDHRKRYNRRMVIASLAAAAVIMIALLPLAGERVRFQRNRDNANGQLALVTKTPVQNPSRAFSAEESEQLRALMHQWMLQISDHRREMFEPVDQLASGIRPLALTFNLALDTLRRTLPGYSEPPPVEPQALYRSIPASIS
ncbi:MAG: hypothetical protein HYV60_01355 [Planctomycetia bacterium]|nr:hypothetical protein [Planctomycetia bacterium]